MTTSAQPNLDIALEYCLCASDPLYFIDTYVQIQHPEYGTIPFKLWGWQAALLDRFQFDKRLILLKARQIGASELAASYALWLVRFHPSKKALIISKNEDAATELLNRATFAHDHLPSWLMAGSESFDGCVLNKSNMSYLEFYHKDGKGQSHPSSIQSSPATKSAGRSKSVSLAILDEWAFQQFDKEIWTGIKPTAEHGSIIGISTANGLGNMFHKTWVNAVAGKNGFTPIFLSWRRHPDRDDAWYERESKDNEPWQLHQASRLRVTIEINRRGCGEIGRRDRLRIYCREACRFEPCHPHHLQVDYDIEKGIGISAGAFSIERREIKSVFLCIFRFSTCFRVALARFLI